MLKPSLHLLRALSNEHVLRALMTRGRATRAELAADTGISKPTVADSVARLTAAGVLVATGDRSTGRGRSGAYYSLSGTAGSALVVGIAPEGIVAEVIDARGGTTARTEAPVVRPARPDRVASVLGVAAQAAVAQAVESASVTGATETGPVRLAVVSAADPVDRATGRTVSLPDAPFLLGDLSPAEVLEPLVDGPVVVDNDVNWAARAERTARPEGPDDFLYLYLGEGLGLAVVSDGVVLRGHRGIAGEISHVLTVGPDGQALPLTGVLAALGLQRPGSTSIDVEFLDRAVTGDARLREALADAIAGVLAACIAVTDPELIVVGGPWGSNPVLQEAVSNSFGRHRRHLPIEAARLLSEPSLAGARAHALDELRVAIIADATG